MIDDRDRTENEEELDLEVETVNDLEPNDEEDARGGTRAIPGGKDAGAIC